MQLEEAIGLVGITTFLAGASGAYFVYIQNRYFKRVEDTLRKIESDTTKLLDGMITYLAPYVKSPKELELFRELAESRMRNQI